MQNKAVSYVRELAPSETGEGYDLLAKRLDQYTNIGKLSVTDVDGKPLGEKHLGGIEDVDVVVIRSGISSGSHCEVFRPLSILGVELDTGQQG